MGSVPHGERADYRGRQRALFAGLACLLSLWVCRAARADDEGQELTVYLMTMGPGAHPFTKFGHSAIWVHDAQRQRDEVYNYGTFAFDSPTLLLDSVQGKLPYWLSVQSLAGTLRSYGEQGRSLLASELELTKEQQSALYTALRENERPEHRYYRYDYYRDNCATRIRDIIDRIVGGKIRAQTAQPASMSYRAHTLRLVADDRLLYVGLDLAVGRQTDAPIRFWDEGFLPQKLHDLLAQTRISQGGRELPLIRSERTLLSGQISAPRAQPPHWSTGFLGVGLVAFGAFAGLGFASRPRARTRARTRARFVLGSSYAVLGFVLGLLGSALCYLTFFSAHSAAASNYNVLLVPPWSLALGVAGLGIVRKSERALSLARWTTSAALIASLLALALHAFTHNPQSNGQELCVAIPLWLGATIAAFLASHPVFVRDAEGYDGRGPAR